MDQARHDPEAASIGTGSDDDALAAPWAEWREVSVSRANSQRDIPIGPQGAWRGTQGMAAVLDAAYVLGYLVLRSGRVGEASKGP